VIKDQFGSQVGKWSNSTTLNGHFIWAIADDLLRDLMSRMLGRVGIVLQWRDIREKWDSRDSAAEILNQIRRRVSQTQRDLH
jgi:hypothetical protein